MAHVNATSGKRSWRVIIWQEHSSAAPSYVYTASPPDAAGRPGPPLIGLIPIVIRETWTTSSVRMDHCAKMKKTNGHLLQCYLQCICHWSSNASCLWMSPTIPQQAQDATILSRSLYTMQCTRSPTLQLHTKVYVQPSDLSCTVVVSVRAKAHMWATHQASWTVSVIAKSSY